MRPPGPRRAGAGGGRFSWLDSFGGDAAHPAGTGRGHRARAITGAPPGADQRCHGYPCHQSGIPLPITLWRRAGHDLGPPVSVLAATAP